MPTVSSARVAAISLPMVISQLPRRPACGQQRTRSSPIVDLAAMAYRRRRESQHGESAQPRLQAETMSKLSSQLAGTAGEHFVVYQLSCLGLVAAMPRAGSIGVDILVTNPDGSKSLTIQVKTTDYAVRKRGRGSKRIPWELQFPLGVKSAKLRACEQDENWGWVSPQENCIVDSGEPCGGGRRRGGL